MALQPFIRALAAVAGSVLADASTGEPTYESNIPSPPYQAGTSYWGSSGNGTWVQYIAGNLPVIFSSGHDGEITTSVITDRVAGNCNSPAEVFSTARDTNINPIAIRIRDEFFARTGRYPHIVISHLHRTELDPNRSLLGGACGDLDAQVPYQEYHDFIDVAKSAVISRYGKGWYTDLHGNGHPIKRLELGYLLDETDLTRTTAQLDAGTVYQDKSSIWKFSLDSPMSFSALLRGNTAFGTMMASAGYPSVPSAEDPYPDPGEPYFYGWSNASAATHGCPAANSATWQNICGVQLEHYTSGIRNSTANTKDYVEDLFGVYEAFLAQNFGISLVSNAGETIVDNDVNNNDPNRGFVNVLSNQWTPGTRFGTVLNNHLTANVPGPTGSGVEFSWNVPQPGQYHVYAWWTSDSTRTTGAAYRVYDGGAVAFDEFRNQRINGGRWNLLRTSNFNADGKVVLSLSLNTGASGTVSADAIRVVRSDGSPVRAQPPLPRGWHTRDIGTVGVTGSASESAGTWTVRGGGADVGGTADAFRYVYRFLVGNGTITARVASLSGTQDWTKVGIMIRGLNSSNTLATNNSNAFMLVAKATKGVVFQWRTSEGATTQSQSGGLVTAPRWVRLTRSGNLITGYVSANGSTWTTVGSGSFTMSSKAEVGLAVSSHLTTSLGTGVFDNVNVVP